MIDNEDIVHLMNTKQSLENICKDLCKELLNLGEIKAQLAIKDAKVKSLIERRKFLEEDIKIQKKRLDNLPK